MQENWIRRYCTRVERQKMECNICHHISNSYLLIKVHLYRKHGIFCDENVDRNNLVWRYFKEEERYASTCKLCDKVLFSGYKEKRLEIHLISKHPQTIKEIRTEITRMWVSQHFKLNPSGHMIKCKICSNMCNIFKVNSLVKHLLKHGVREKPVENTEENSINVNHSAAEESNMGTSFHQIDTHSQDEENVNDLQSASIRPKQKKAMQKNWIWKYCTRVESQKIKCNICHYSIRLFAADYLRIKVHLYRAHGIYRNKNMNRSNLMWRYFKEEQKYAPTCKLCDKVFLSGYKEKSLEIHLISKHPQTIKEIQTEITRMWISQHFELGLSSHTIKCKICCKMFNIFKVDILMNHLLKHDIKEKPQENTKENNMNVAVNRSAAKENRVVTHSQAQENRKDFERYGANIMPQQKNENKNWIWEHISGAESDEMKCNICHYVTRNFSSTKSHLYHEHGIFHDEDTDRSNLVWQYFTEEERNSPKCKLCNKMFLSEYDEYNLEEHLISVHPLTTKEIRKQIGCIWVSQHFAFSTSSYKIKCKTCCKMFNIFRVDFLVNHLLEHDIKEKPQENTEGNNINVTVNQSVAEENKTDTRLQVQKNGKDLERYCADITQSQKNENENWLWEYFSRAKHSYKMICNICHYVTSNLLFTKIHLYYEHEIFRDEDSDRSNLVWRYFTEGERCIPKCKLCNKMFLSGYDEYNLEQHMIFVHPLTTEKIREEVKRIWVSQHFTFSRLSHEIKCKICYKMFNIFRVDFLLSHLLKHGINKKSQVYTEKNNMNVTINK
ncbi:PREDICTED: uncharacterized protein LOC105450592 [Wasmannia auropunctata]|uniref:uncharacterized protein LOC105450592 n=1 Tax=Wasmannia auropunctata TaxID=64793 RepID=UPI0005EF2C5E|nr:PREDICTED: uncharacterized protein LOC105450592 [Wasmannia auropunctata]